MKKIAIIFVALLLLTVCVGTTVAWEPPEDFVWETPYAIDANCGGGCLVQLGSWLADFGLTPGKA